MCIVDRRGTLEVAGSVRSKDGMKPATTESADDEPIKQVEKPRAAESRLLVVPIVTHTPGPATLQELMLKRVFHQ